MEYRLLESSVVKACEKHWEANKHECNWFVQAVAAELGILIPGSKADANIMTWWITNWLGSSGTFLAIPPGPSASFHAAQFANKGQFVIAGMTAKEIDVAKDWHPPMSTAKHGHVAVVTPGLGIAGWPRGYWGAHGSVGMKNASLSKAFPWKRPDLCHYFTVSVT